MKEMDVGKGWQWLKLIGNEHAFTDINSNSGSGNKVIMQMFQQ